jgi:hypothetical protein
MRLFMLLRCCQDEEDARMLAEAVEYARSRAEAAPLAPLLQRIGRTQQAWDAAGAAAPFLDAALLEAPAAPQMEGGPSSSSSSPERAHSSAAGGLQQPRREDGSTRDALLAAQILTAVRHPADFHRWSQGAAAQLTARR